MGEALKDRVALVVGASSGIGRETAKLLAREGARVMAAARREDRLRSLKEELAAEGLAIGVAAADAGSCDEMVRLAERTKAEIGEIEILVYATGTNTPDRAMSRLSVKEWDRMMSVNLDGAFYITQALLPAMRAAGSGLLIYISSISGLRPDVSGAAYQAAKRGMLGLAHAVLTEEGRNGIRTSVICPGLVDTEILDLRPQKPARETLDMALRPEDVAEIVVAVAKLPRRAVVPELQIVPTYLVGS